MSVVSAAAPGLAFSIALLSGSQAMLFAVTSTLVVLNGLAGLALAPHPSLATLPATCVVLGTLATTLPASSYMARVGRRTGLAHGALVGVGAALAAAAALSLNGFWLLCAAAILFGVFNGFGQYYRFAAADLAQPSTRASAIALVLAGGLLGGMIGPNLSRITVDALPVRYAGAYLALAGFALVACVLARHIRESSAAPCTPDAARRTIAELAAQPRFAVAVLAGAIGYAVMSLLMTATPIAMSHGGHGYGEAAFVISSHVIAMFLPSLFTGTVIRRVGVLPVLAAGALLDFGAVAIALSGSRVAEFWWALVLLGVGWNFLYVGGTTLLADAYRPEERALAQGANEFVIFSAQAIASLASGAIVTAAGWERVNRAVLPLLVVVIAAIAWLMRVERAASSPVR
jgi:MFS family permease